MIYGVIGFCESEIIGSRYYRLKWNCWEMGWLLGVLVLNFYYICMDVMVKCKVNVF